MDKVFSSEQEKLLNSTFRHVQDHSSISYNVFKEKLALYSEELLKANQITQLISRKDEENLVDRHLVESIALLSAFDFSSINEIIDLGTGGGLPGVPLAILFPEKQINLIESKKKKCIFLREIKDRVRLTNIHIFDDRAESVAEKGKLNVDLVVARAVTQLPKLWEWARPFLWRKKGCLAAMKGGNIDDELAAFKELYPDSKVIQKNYSPDLVASEKERFLLVVKE